MAKIILTFPKCSIFVSAVNQRYKLSTTQQKFFCRMEKMLYFCSRNHFEKWKQQLHTQTVRPQSACREQERPDPYTTTSTLTTTNSTHEWSPDWKISSHGSANSPAKRACPKVA